MKLHPLLKPKAVNCGRLLLAASLTLLGCLPSAFAASLRPGFIETRIATGLSSPVSFFLHPTDGRVFVCEKGGKVRVIKNGALLSTAFLTVPVDTAGDRGLFTMIVDNSLPVQFVFVFYTAKTPTIHNRVSRFTVNQSNPDTVVAGSELVLLDLPTSTNNFNNGGALVLNDGLYISTGDDGVPANAQSLNSLFGKVLRINFEGTPGSIPTSNPFYTQTTGNNRAIWALGFRNPYPMTLSYDVDGSYQFVTHDIADVMEKNLVKAGKNYGWPVCDGSCQNAGFTNPVSERELFPGGDCPVKGATIHNNGFVADDNCGCGPVYAGSYFFTDCDSIEIDHADGSHERFAYGINQPSGLATDNNGKGGLWYLERGTGSLYRVALDTPCLTSPKITVPPQDQSVLAGARATLSVQATTESGCGIRYQWFHEEGDGDATPIPGAYASTYTFTATDREFDNVYRVMVSNAVGSVTSGRVSVNVLKDRLLEAETLTVLNSSGDAIHVINESAASAGAASLVDSNAVNDQVTYLVPYVYAGTYSIKVRFKKASNRGKVQLLTGKYGSTLSNVGAAVDLYSASAAYQEVTIGTWTAASSSDKQFSFKVTGKNASSSGYSMCIDSIKLVPQ